MNNDIYPSLNDFLNSKITRESIKYYKKIFEKEEDEKNIKDNIKYITQYILHRELKSKKNIKIIVEQLKFTNIQNKKQILEKVIYQLKEKFIDFNIYTDPNETYIFIDWS